MRACLVLRKFVLNHHDYLIKKEKFSLYCLPEEVLIRIFKNLGGTTDLHSVILTCRKFCRIGEDTFHKKDLFLLKHLRFAVQKNASETIKLMLKSTRSEEIEIVFKMLFNYAHQEKNEALMCLAIKEDLHNNFSLIHLETACRHKFTTVIDEILKKPGFRLNPTEAVPLLQLCASNKLINPVLKLLKFTNSQTQLPVSILQSIIGRNGNGPLIGDLREVIITLMQNHNVIEQLIDNPTFLWDLRNLGNR